MEKHRQYDRLTTPYHALIAASSGFFHSMRYRSALEIAPSENGRYLRKSRNLAMCYAGFAQNQFSHSQARGEGKAAFLSCAYDVASDWKKGSTIINSFENIVNQEASQQLADMAIGLLHRDIQGSLQYDGLERGIVATRFILEMMGLQ